MEEWKIFGSRSYNLKIYRLTLVYGLRYNLCHNYKYLKVQVSAMAFNYWKNLERMDEKSWHVVSVYCVLCHVVGLILYPLVTSLYFSRWGNQHNFTDEGIICILTRAEVISYLGGNESFPKRAVTLTWILQNELEFSNCIHHWKEHLL